MSKLLAKTPATLTVEFSTTDPKLAQILNSIGEFNEFTSCRHELEAKLYAFLHETAIREAERLKNLERKRKPHGDC